MFSSCFLDLSPSLSPSHFRMDVVYVRSSLSLLLSSRCDTKSCVAEQWIFSAFVRFVIIDGDSESETSFRRVVHLLFLRHAVYMYVCVCVYVTLCFNTSKSEILRYEKSVREIRVDNVEKVKERTFIIVHDTWYHFKFYNIEQTCLNGITFWKKSYLKRIYYIIYI